MPAVIQTRDEPPPLTRLAGSLHDVPIAPTLEIPDKRIVCIEHPCIIKNLDQALKSMGGEPRMRHILDHHIGDSLANPSKPRPEPEVGVSLRPNDPFAARITSTGIQTRNVLLKVTIPKRTGRKRKRGSDDPFSYHTSDQATPTSVSAPDLLRRLRDNENDYVIEPVGMVEETHRFRSLPDFQVRARDVPIFQELNTHILQPKWSRLKDFSLDQNVGLPIMSSFPAPPTFAAGGQPYRYEYQQASAVRFKRDEAGNVSSLNLQAGLRKLVLPIPPDIAEIPQGPPPGLKPHSSSATQLEYVVSQLQALLDERPLVTTRVALNHLGNCGDTTYREATQWVGYSFKAGPFRDTLIKYGVDPRKDPKHRIYQTLMFQLDKRAARATGDSAGRWNRSMRHLTNPEEHEKQSHMFDGKHVSLNGKTWQVCDITDPLIKRILDTPNLREECDSYGFGWYHDGTLCKARVIMREKMECLFEGKEIEEPLYELVATIPDHIDELPADRASGYFGTSMLAGKAQSLASDVRGLAKAGIKGNMERMKKSQDLAAVRQADIDPDYGDAPNPDHVETTTTSAEDVAAGESAADDEGGVDHGNPAGSNTANADEGAADNGDADASQQ